MAFACELNTKIEAWGTILAEMGKLDNLYLSPKIFAQFVASDLRQRPTDSLDHFRVRKPAKLREEHANVSNRSVSPCRLDIAIMTFHHQIKGFLGAEA